MTAPTEVRSLGAGSTSEPIAFGIPNGCFNPDCEFRLRVDINDDVKESNEGNNTSTGSCSL